jgi:hypothetical protein
MDTNLNVFGNMTYVDRDTWIPFAVYGQKLSQDGRFIFQPLLDGIDIHDGQTGLLLNRVQFPIQFAPVYDSLALDNTDALIFGITSSGIVQIDFQSLQSEQSDSSSLKRTLVSRRLEPRRETSPLRSRKNQSQSAIILPSIRHAHTQHDGKTH